MNHSTTGPTFRVVNAARPILFLMIAAVGLMGPGRSVPAAASDEAGNVTVHDSGPQVAPVTFECTSGHKAETRLMTFDSGTAKYTFRYCGCQDASHGDRRPAAEGNFGMPAPITANWYWGGFFFIQINGKEATEYRLVDLRVLETGPRGGMQIIWAHPDADVGLRLLMLPGANHVMAHLAWKPRVQAAVKSVAVRLVCYPSFFTAARHRQGERHCRTPRIDQREPETLTLVPEQDRYLYYYDKVFDTAKGEGEGPCAALVASQGVQGGQVHVGGYAVITELDLRPDAGQARLAFCDFTGRTNAEGEAYLKAHAAEDLARLVKADFRPQSVRSLDANRLKSDAARLLAAAADDAKPYRAKVEDLLARVASLKAPVDQGDWKAEAELASALSGSEDLFWKLKALAALNTAAP